MDNILTWNIRGLNGLNKQQELQVICNKYKIGLSGVVETKMTEEALSLCKMKWFNDWGSAHNTTVGRGRIWLLWQKSSFHAEIITLLTDNGYMQK